MIRKMTSKERIIAAVCSKEVDYVPMDIPFYTPGYDGNSNEPSHTNVTWGMDERKRLEAFRQWGWDAYLSMYIPVTPLDCVKTSIGYEIQNGVEILHQSWQTPAGTIDEKLKMSEDWVDANNRTENYPFLSDFRTARYLEHPFKDAKDLDTLDYLFPMDNPKDTEAILKEYYKYKTLADEFQVPLFVCTEMGMDWLMWLYPPQEAILKLIEEPESIDRLLTHISNAKLNRLEMLLKLGIDGVMRRGWYESTDFWSPDIFRKFARPAIEKEVQIVHDAKIPYIYLMFTGIMPLLDDLAAIPFDCLYGAEPAFGCQDLGTIRKSLPGKAIWGGISGPENVGNGTPEQTEEAVERAFDILGRTGFVLSTAASFRHYWSWENLMALERAWKRLR